MFGRPTVLTIAGFDPSGCAGLLADVKTFEAHKVNGMAVCTANTFQNVEEFVKPNWIQTSEILKQFHLLIKNTSIDFVKIGLVENFEILFEIVTALKKYNSKIKIIWDPICNATSGAEFHHGIDKNILEEICKQIYIITPNLIELKLLIPEKTIDDAGKYLAQFCNVLVKGGHGGGFDSTDTLYTENSVHYLKCERLGSYSKRGTGCVLSAAITANLATGLNLFDACETAKKYILNYLLSNQSQIGYHYHEEHK